MADIRPITPVETRSSRPTLFGRRSWMRRAISRTCGKCSRISCSRSVLLSFLGIAHAYILVRHRSFLRLAAAAGKLRKHRSRELDRQLSAKALGPDGLSISPLAPGCLAWAGARRLFTHAQYDLVLI